MANRLSGVALTFLALLMIVLIIPANTDSVDYGWMKPATLPAASCWAIAILGLLQAIGGRGRTHLQPRQAWRAGVALILSIVGLALMARFGFLVGGCLLAAALMLLTGERRPLWLAGGALLAPMTAWVVIVPLLGRTLP